MWSALIVLCLNSSLHKARILVALPLYYGFPFKGRDDLRHFCRACRENRIDSLYYAAESILQLPPYLEAPRR